MKIEQLTISFATNCDFEESYQEPHNASLVPVWSLGSAGSACSCHAKSDSWQPVFLEIDHMPDVLNRNVKKHAEACMNLDIKSTVSNKREITVRIPMTVVVLHSVRSLELRCGRLAQACCRPASSRALLMHSRRYWTSKQMQTPRWRCLCVLLYHSVEYSKASCCAQLSNHLHV